MDLATILQLLDSTLRLSTPLLLACLAGLFSERAGIFDIGLEGKMLAAAFVAGAAAAVSGSAWIGFFAGIGASLAMALLHGLASITLKGNQLISGVAINFLASGLTALVGQNWFRQGGQTPQLSGDSRFNSLTLPFAENLQGVPVIGPIYYDLISGHNILVYVALLCVPATWWVLFRTRFGLRLRAVGENPGAVDTAGVSVVRQRYAAVLICGLLCGIAGAYLSTGISSGFVRDMTAGKGFIALAALIFAKWRPWPALWACLLFGLLEAIGIRYQNIEIMEFLALVILLGVVVSLVSLTLGLVAWMINVAEISETIAPMRWFFGFALFGLLLKIMESLELPILDWSLPVQLMQALPYILTVVILAGFVGKAIPPKAGGVPYVKER